LITTGIIGALEAKATWKAPFLNGNNFIPLDPFLGKEIIRL
jgi:hypothetical protein